MTMKLNIMACLLVLLCGCAKKPYPDSVSTNDPQYSVTAEIGNEQVKLSAGVEGYYLYSDLTTDATSVNVVSGEYRNSDCNTCRVLKVELRDYKTGSTVPMKTDSLFRQGLHGYVTETSALVYPVSFRSSFNKNAKRYAWDFGDGTTAVDANPVHAYSQPGKYAVKVKAYSENGCESTALNEVTVGDAPDFTNVLIKDSLGMTYFQAETTLSGGLRYKWEFGNGDTLGSNSRIVAYKHPVRGSYLVALTVKSASGSSRKVWANYVTTTDLSSCAVNMRLRTMTTTPRLDLSKVRISWTDAAGVLWTSVGAQSESAFEILSAEPAGNNENGKPIYKVRVQFNCNLYNGTHVMAVKNASATIAFPIQ